MKPTIKYKLYEQYINGDNKKIYEKKFCELKNLKKIYLLDFKNNLNNSTFLIPIKEIGLVMPVFEEKKLAEQYLEINKEFFKESLIIQETSYGVLEYLIENLFYKGLDGILYYTPNPIFYKTTRFIKNDLITEDTTEVINILNRILLAKENFYYMYKNLSVDEVLLGVVKFLIRTDGKNKYVDLFLSREDAENYCKKKNIIVDCYNNSTNKTTSNTNVLRLIGDDKEQEKYPVSSIMNDMLFHSINKEDEKIDQVKIHTNKKTYNIKTKEFLRLVMNVGFNVINLR